MCSLKVEVTFWEFISAERISSGAAISIFFVNEVEPN